MNPSGRDPIRGKVARIVNSRELALNIGAQQGVRLGMLFDVLDEKTADIRDPDSQEVLGSIYKPKIRVKVIKVEERVSLASTFRETRTNVGGTGPGLTSLGSDWARLFEGARWVTKTETLRAEDHGLDDLEEQDSLVKVGEVVVEVVDVPKK